MAAFSIARNLSKKKAFALMYSFLILGIFVPFQVIMIPITTMMTKLGLSNIPGLIILYLAYAIPQTLFLYVGYIKTAIPEELDEAAEIDGCGKFRMYFQIAYPLMKPMHATTLIINALWIWNDFLLPLLILNKDNSNWTLPLFQYNYQGQYFSDYGPSFASYVVGIIVILIVYLIFQKNIISGSKTKIAAIVTRFFCPKLNAEIGQCLKGYSPQIFNVWSTLCLIVSSSTLRKRKPRAISSKIIF